MAKGRPPKTDEDRLLEGARVLEVALLLRQGRLGKLADMGFTEAQALRYVSKRRRGIAGELVGDDAVPPPNNKTRAALRLVVEHGMPVAKAADVMGLDRRNLVRLKPQAEAEFQKIQARQAAFAARTRITDAESDGS